MLPIIYEKRHELNDIILDTEQKFPAYLRPVGGKYGGQKGMASLLGSLENLCLEYSGLLQMAKDNDDRWAVHLSSYRKANSGPFAQKFDAILAEFQRNPDSPDGFQMLEDILAATLLAKSAGSL